jgi:hypothetical protein
MIRCRGALELRQVVHGVASAVIDRSAHLDRRHELPTHGGPLGATEQLAAAVLIQLYAAHACRLAVE